MSLKSFLIALENPGEGSQEKLDRETLHSLSTKEKRSEDAVPSSTYTNDDGSKSYCFKNTDPVEYKTRFSEYPFDLVEGSTHNDTLMIELARIKFKANQRIDSVPVDVKQVKAQYQNGLRLNISVLPDDVNNQNVIGRYESDGLQFQNRLPAHGENYVILNSISNNVFNYSAGTTSNPPIGFETIVAIFRTNVPTTGYQIFYNTDTTVVISMTSATVESSSTYHTPALQAEDISPTTITNRLARYFTPASLTRISTSNNDLGRIVISESKDGFWKVKTENFSIQLKIAFEGYGVMGGTFGNWMIDSGFKTVELNYEYQRDGRTVFATTVTTPKPTRKCGQYRPQFGQLQYSGQMMALSHDDIVNVYYTERDWTLANAIYAKNFATDFNQTFKVTADSSEFLVRTNVIPHFVPNSPGVAEIGFKSGGFGQIDTSSYTGMALSFRFICLNDDLRVPANYPREIAETFANSGHISYYCQNGTCTVEADSVSGFGSCYARKVVDLPMSVTYTTLIPSDPEFVTGGTDFAQTVTARVEDSILALRNEVNNIITRMNISDLTSGIMSFASMAMSFPQIVEGVINATRSVMKAFQKVKGRVNGVAQRLRGRRRVRLFDIESIISETPTLADSVRINSRHPSLANMLSDDQTFTALHNFATSTSRNADEIVYIQPAVTTRIINSTPPAIVPADAIVYSDIKKISKVVGRDISSESILEFNQIRNTISVLDNAKHLAEYAVDPDVIDLVLSKMAGGHARSLFSLKVRKHLLDSVEPDSFIKYSYHDLVERLLNDKQLIDITNNLSVEKQLDLAKEFTELLKNAFT
uniref:Outer capsid spike protein n=1 Tax=Rotavirus H TaxID=1348384 RepID=A0A3G1DM44_9REOV|nr:outer capsid spike protein [Rotavirus H]